MFKWFDYIGVGDYGCDEVCEWVFCWWWRYLYVGVEVKLYVFGEESMDVYFCGVEYYVDGVYMGLVVIF